MSSKQFCWLLFFVLTLLAGAALTLSGLSQPSHQSGPGAPLEGVVEGVASLLRLGLGLGLLAIAIVSFVLRPRTPVLEIPESELSPEHMEVVSGHTGLLFPRTARLVGLCHRDISLASHVATKFILPESDRENFLQNKIFISGIERQPHYGLGSRTAWWRRGRLQSRVDRVQYLRSGTYVECSLGIEDGQTVVYVSWA